MAHSERILGLVDDAIYSSASISDRNETRTRYTTHACTGDHQRTFWVAVFVKYSPIAWRLQSSSSRNAAYHQFYPFSFLLTVAHSASPSYFNVHRDAAASAALVSSATVDWSLPGWSPSVGTTHLPSRLHLRYQHLYSCRPRWTAVTARDLPTVCGRQLGTWTSLPVKQVAEGQSKRPDTTHRRQWRQILTTDH